LSTIGAYLIGISVVLFVVNVVRSLRRGQAATENPWDAPDLTGATLSPPPPHNFDVVPVVDSRHPLWPSERALAWMTGLRADRREALITTTMDAIPAARWAMPDPSSWPLWSALALTVLFIWSIFSPWGVVWGAIPVAITMTVWFWPKRTDPSLGGGE
jgi:hypothetical protein